MEEFTEKRDTCSICGDELKTEPEHGSLCNSCTDAWAREIECPW